ncbi:MAG: TdeIII family type II restriction endonuclease [bacterium]|jgi:hypothetical protein
MSNLPSSCKAEIKKLLLAVVREKLNEYSPETQYMPFHHRLLGKDRYALFSFIHSMNTTLGTSIWEQLSTIIARSFGKVAQHGKLLMGEIDSETVALIEKIHHSLRTADVEVNKTNETELIKRSIKSGKALKHPDSKVDFYLVTDGQENFIDLKTAKPNKEGFEALKRKLLNWTALKFSQNPAANVMTRLAIPYNPYHPKPYDRWTLKGLFDLKAGEVLVGEDYWNFIASSDIHNELLDVFSEAGNALRPEIDEKFSSIGNAKNI